jgi:hypothetical protein
MSDPKPEVQNIDDNLGMVNYILLSRIYDVLCLIADGVGKGEEMLQLIESHKDGKLLGPDPALIEEVVDEA